MIYDPILSIPWNPDLEYSIQETDPKNHRPIFLIKNLSGLEAKSIIESKPFVFKWRSYTEKLLEIEMQLSDYFDFESKNFVHFNTLFPGAFDDSIRRNRLVNVNRLLKNYVFTWRSCIELMENEIKKYYGKSEETTQFKEFKKISSQLFDNNFEYRFFTKLRNVAAHVDNIVPLMRNSQGQVTPMFSKKLLLDSGVFSQKLKKDFERYALSFPIKPILDKSFELIKILIESTMIIHRDLFISNAIKMLDAAGGFHMQNVGFSVEIDGKRRCENLPTWICKQILEYYDY